MIQSGHRELLFGSDIDTYRAFHTLSLASASMLRKLLRNNASGRAAAASAWCAVRPDPIMGSPRAEQLPL